MLLSFIAAALAADVLVPGTVQADRPTITTLGVQWLVNGDDDHDASVSVRFAAAGSGKWADALPLRRVYPADVEDWTVPDQFAGSVFDLLPGTTYDVELHATDPDGLDQTETISMTTRSVPTDPVHPNAVAVSTVMQLDQALNNATAGDVITIADGTYTGSFSISDSGTAENPIVIRGESAAGVVLDGDDCSCNVVEIYGSYTHIENLTIQNAQRALRFQGEGTIGNVARRIHAQDVGLGFAVKEDQLDFTICDNQLDGPLAWPHIYPDDGGKYSNVDGIQIMGAGHVVCHNTLRGWGDSIKVAQDGSRAIDFYGNDVYEGYDNGLEFDSSEGNVRGFRNRFTNTYATISFQPVYGGPAYAWRNVELNTAHEQLKLHNETSGIVVLHNTFLSATHAWTLSDSSTTHHLWVQGNLFLGPAKPSDGRTVEYSGGLDDAVIDGNGWYNDGRFDFDEFGDWDSFAEMQAAGTFESNGVLLATMPFASGLTAPKDYTVEIATDDASLDPTSAAVDAAMVLPNVGGVVGKAPDLGAQELGCEIPIYGVRPEGVDEDDGPPSCDSGSDGGGTDGTDDSGTNGTGGGETGGDDTMSDDSGGGGDVGGDIGGDVGGEAEDDTASGSDKDGCGCGSRPGGARPWLLAAGCDCSDSANNDLQIISFVRMKLRGDAGIGGPHALVLVVPDARCLRLESRSTAW